MTLHGDQFQKGFLGDLFDLEYGSGLPERVRSGIGYPVFGSNGIVGRHSDFLVQGPGIVVGRKGSVGEVCWSTESFWPINTAYYIMPKGQTDLRWLFWLLTSTNLKSLDAATGVPRLNRNDVYEVQAHIPESTEQSRIAAVLDTVDEAIAKTDAVIAKLKQVRAGLLHDLLTRGLDENGQLRDPIAHPEQFQDSPIGRIPKKWLIAPLQDCCEAIIDCPHSTPEYLDTGILVARTMHIKNAKFDTTNASRVTEEEYKARVARLKPKPWDVIFTREAPVGEAFVIPDGMTICLGQRVMLFRPVDNFLLGMYLVAHIYFGVLAETIKKLTGGTTNPHLNVADVRGLSLPIPPFNEQRAISKNISCLDAQLESEEANLEKLQQLKSALMADLLTGRVRVPANLEFG